MLPLVFLGGLALGFLAQEIWRELIELIDIYRQERR